MTNKMIKRGMVICLSGLCLAVAPAHAAVLVSWGSSDSYVTSPQQFSSTSTAGVPFSETVALSPTSGYSGTSSTFYGGYARESGFFSPPPNYQAVANSVNYAGGNDAITLRASSGPSNLGRAAAVFTWNKANFLGGMDSNPANLSDPTSRLSVTFGMESGALFNASTAQARFVVKQGGSYYISDQFVAHTPGSLLTFNLNPASATWSTFSPAATYASMSYSANTTAVTLNDVQAVGVQFQLDPNANSSASAIGISSFWAADVVAIPEPGAAALVVLGGLLLAFARRSFVPVCS